MTQQSVSPPETGKHGATCHRSDGSICDGWPMNGTTICRRHLPDPRARANAAMRHAVAAFDDRTEHADPGTTLLRMLSYAADRQRYYAGLLARKHDELSPTATLDDEIALAVFDTYSEGGKSGEQIRALVKWEAHWLDKTAHLAKIALDAGIAERTVRLAEQQGVAIVEAFKAYTLAMGREWNTEARDLASRALLTIEGGAA